MTKAELIEAVAKDTGMSKSAAKATVESVFDTIGKSLKNNNGVSILGFGSFNISDRPTRIGRNPRTGEQIAIPAKKVVRFRPGGALTKAINEA